MPMLRPAALLVGVLLATMSSALPQSRPSPQARSIYLDRQGVIRWQDDRSEVVLYGANYVLPSASD